MDSIFTVTLRGFDEGAALKIERMLREHVAGYPDRVSMDSATVETAPEPKAKAKAKAKTKVKRHAQS